MRRLAARGWILVAAAVALSASASAIGAQARPSQPSAAAARTVPIIASVRVCPTTSDGQPVVSGTRTYLNAASLPEVALPAPVPATPPVTDGVRVKPLFGSSTPLLTVTSAGGQDTTNLIGPTGVTKPSVLHAQGALAPGATATQVTYVPTGARRALVGQECTAPTGSAWFVGGSGASGRITTVELDNPDSSPAVADIIVYGEHGQIEAPAGRGLTVPANGFITRRIDVLAPGVVRAALHVILREGRAAITVTDQQTIGLIPRGADVIPATAPPARRVIVPGVPGGQTGSRNIQILAPGDQDALVQVQVIGRDGRFTPDNLAALDVPAGTVIEAQVLSQVGDGSVGLIITSDQPVVAGVRNVLPSPDSTPDVTYSAATHSIRGPVLVPGLKVSTGWASHLLVSAPSTDASVTITLLHPDGTSTNSIQPIAGGTSDELILQGPASFTAVVTPDVTAGPVFAEVALSYKDAVGQLMTEWPLVTAPFTVTLPAVQTDPALGVPTD